MWPLFALGGGVFAAVNSIFQKETLKHLHAVQLVTVTTFSTVILSLLLIPYINFNISLELIALLAFSAIVQTFAIIFSIKAMRHMDVSVVAPFFNIGTAFTAILGLIIFREVLGPVQALGIIILVIGGYILELKHKNLLQPLRDIIKSRFIHYLLGGVFLFSGGFVLAKFVLERTDPITYLFFQNIGVLILLLMITFTFYGGIKDIKRCIECGGWIIPLIGLTAILEYILMLEALKSGPVSLVVPLYRTWTLWAVIFGGRLLHENHLAKRAIASVLMIAGAALILV